jgi:hypothetical protein
MLDMIWENVRGTKKYVKDNGGTKVKNILYFIFSQSMKGETIVKHSRKGMLERFSFHFFFGGQQGTQKRMSRTMRVPLKMLKDVRGA